MQSRTLVIENQEIEIEAYQPHPRNYNQLDDAQIERIMLSLQKFGQPRSVMVWRDYFIAGQGCYVLRSMGYEESIDDG